MAQSAMEEALQLTPFQDTDYPALSDFLTALRPGQPTSAAAMRQFDAGRTAGEHHARVLAWDGDALVGVAETERCRQFTRPGWYGLHLHASDPAVRNTLEHAALDLLHPLSPTVLHTTVSESWPEHGWLTQRGWHEHERTWLSHLDLTSFQPEHFTARLARAQTEGIEVRTLSDLGWDGSEHLQRRVYDLTVQLLADVPTTDPVLPWPFEVWRDRVLGHPDFTPSGPLIAVSGSEWVGLTELYLPRREVPGLLHQGLTGVRREWRGKGVAWALKLTAAARARAQGWTAVRTGNHTVNHEMLGINAALGFVRGTARVVLIRTWPEVRATAPVAAATVAAPPSGG